MVHRIIYASKAAPGVTLEDFRVIAMFSAVWNTNHDITGLLMSYNDDIMQVLEGPKDAVQDLYRRIERDPRHENVQLLVDQTAERREFTKWSMGFRTLDSRADMDVFFALSQDTLDAVVPEDTSPDVAAAVERFKTTSGLNVD